MPAWYNNNTIFEAVRVMIINTVVSWYVTPCSSLQALSSGHKMQTARPIDFFLERI